MMKPIQIISQDVFDKIRSRFKNLEMGDESGAVTIDPVEARFFDFDFVVEGNDLGRVSISLNDLGSLKIYYSQGITENVDDSAKRLWYRFLKEMRQFAMRRLLRFDTRDISKSNLDKRDFQYLAKKNSNQSISNLSKDKEMTQMNESRWNHKSSRKTSRAVQGKTQVIVRHSRPVDETYPGARSQRKNIRAIFIENSDGERFKYPFIHPAGAFAMAQHVDHGGVPHDPAGKAIMRMSEEIAQLQEFQRHVQRSQLHDDAMGITERACQKMMELKKTIESLSKRHYYENWIAEFNETEDDGLMELDPVTMEDYKSKFTQTNFQEELSKYFPLIHKIMRETNNIDLEDYVKEADDKGKYTVYCSQCGGEFKRDKREGFSHCKNHAGMKNYDLDENNQVDDFGQFVEWAEAVEQGKLTDDQIQELRNALMDLSVPLDLDTAYNFFNEFGIDDSDLENKFQQAKELDSSTDPIEVFKLWANENYPELLLALGMSDTGAEQPPAEEPEQPTEENDEMQAPPGLMERRSSIIKEVAKIVKQFYNEDNPKVGPFRTEEGVLLDVEKKISEMFGEEAGSQARELAEKYIQKLSNEWQQRHSQSIDDGGLARLRELANIVKAKVEGIGDRGHSGEDFNLNIMSAEESEQGVAEGSEQDDPYRGATPAQGKTAARNAHRLGITYTNPHSPKYHKTDYMAWDRDYNSEMARLKKKNVAEGSLNEEAGNMVVRQLITDFNKQMSGSPYYPLDYKDVGMRSWTRGDRSRYKDPGYIYIDKEMNPQDIEKYLAQKPIEKFWDFLSTKGAKKIGDVSGEFGSDPHSPAVVLGKLIFVYNGKNISWGSTSRLKNSSVWRQKQQQGVEEGYGSLEEGMSHNIVVAFAILGGILLGGHSAYVSHKNQQRWMQAYEQIKQTDPATAEKIRELVQKYKTHPLKFGPDNLSAYKIDKIISDFENQKLKEQGVAEGSLNEFNIDSRSGGDDGDDDDSDKIVGPSHFPRAVDFFSLFEEDTFDKEVQTQNGWEGYVMDEEGELQKAAGFTFDNPSQREDDDPGIGWYMAWMSNMDDSLEESQEQSELMRILNLSGLKK